MGCFYSQHDESAKSITMVTKSATKPQLNRHNRNWNIYISKCHERSQSVLQATPLDHVSLMFFQCFSCGGL